MNPIYTYTGGIRTYHYLLECRMHGRNKIDKVDQLMNIYMIKNRYTSPQNIEVDNDSESDINPEEEQRAGTRRGYCCG